MVLDRRAAALFGDRPVLLDAARRSPAAGELKVAERIFAREPLALAMRRDDDAFRLVVDRTLSRLFRSKDIAALYAEHFGPMDVGGALFYQLAALPE
jgi:ABC-type amino acid transport substrate-binding protein